METTLENSSGRHSPVIRFIWDGISRETCATFVGFGSLIAWVQLYETHLLTNDVALFNFCQYGSIAQLATFAVMAVMGAWRAAAPCPVIGSAAGAVGALGIAISLASPGTTFDIIGAVIAGMSLAVLSICWGTRLSVRPPRSILLLVLKTLLAATVLCLVCSSVDSIVSEICGIGLPLLSGGFLVRKTPQPDRAGRATSSKSLPWPFLIVLMICCVSGSFFVGVALDPFIFQSSSVSRFGYLFSLAAFAAMLTWSAVIPHAKAQTLFIATLVILLIGLFLFSSGLLGSIILPLGLILAAKSCCMALCWITFSTLIRTRTLTPTVTLSCGFLLCNGTLGRSVGMLVSNRMAPSFPDIALAASVCIVAFTLFYVFMVASHPDASQALSPSATNDQKTPTLSKGSSQPSTPIMPFAPMGVRERSSDSPTAEQLIVRARRMQDDALRSFNLTPQERRVARLILREMTYQQIAEKCSISERTVKFHAKNIYSKTGAESRRDFEVKMLAKGR